jgi:hypothetical protein
MNFNKEQDIKHEFQQRTRHHIRKIYGLEYNNLSLANLLHQHSKVGRRIHVISILSKEDMTESFLEEITASELTTNDPVPPHVIQYTLHVMAISIGAGWRNNTLHCF